MSSLHFIAKNEKDSLILSQKNLIIQNNKHLSKILPPPMMEK